MDATTSTKSRTFYRYAFNCVLNDPVFSLRNKAVRMGITRYVKNTRNNTYSIRTDKHKLAVMYAVEMERFNDIYECFVKDTNTSYCKGVSIEECDIYKKIDYGMYEVESIIRPNHNLYIAMLDAEEKTIQLVNHLKEGGIYNIHLTKLREHIKDDILYYQEENEEEDEEDEEVFESDSCPICYEEWSNVSKQHLPCNHIICKECVKRLTTKSCPICRLEFKNSDIENTYIERTDQELRNYMDNETSQEICETWFNDINTLAEDLLVDNEIEDFISHKKKHYLLEFMDKGKANEIDILHKILNIEEYFCILVK